MLIFYKIHYFLKSYIINNWKIIQKTKKNKSSIVLVVEERKLNCFKNNLIFLFHLQTLCFGSYKHFVLGHTNSFKDNNIKVLEKIVENLVVGICGFFYIDYYLRKQ